MAELRKVYELFLEKGEKDRRFSVEEKGEAPGKCSVRFYRKGTNRVPFSFIVNTGKRADYHLFYVRFPKAGERKRLIEEFGLGAVNENPRGEITVKITTSDDAERMWKHVESF